jgi:hypothetical protein
MDLSKKFKVASTSFVVKLPTLEVDRAYSNLHAEKFQTKFGETILLIVQDFQNHLMKAFLPKRYGVFFTVENLNSFNKNTVSLALKYIGICPTTKSYLLEIVYECEMCFYFQIYLP